MQSYQVLEHYYTPPLEMTIILLRDTRSVAVHAASTVPNVMDLIQEIVPSTADVVGGGGALGLLCLPPLAFGAFAAAVTFFALRVAVTASAGCGCCVVTAVVAEPRLARAPATPPTGDAVTTAPSATSGASPGASGPAASAVGCFRFVCFPFFACLAFGSLAGSYISTLVQFRKICCTWKHSHAYGW